MKLIPDRLRRRSEPGPDGTMTLVDHLTELRYRLLVSIAAICVGAIVGWTLFDRVIDLLTDPYCDYLRTVPRGVRATRDCALFYSGALEPLLTADRFLSFVMLVALSFGLAFEFPIVLVFLLLAGAVSTRQLRDWRRGAILFIAVFAAIITPSSDPYTMLAMTIPMVLFYEAAIIVGRLLKR